MVAKQIGGAKNGKTREVPATKAPKFYPADDIPAKAPSAREAASASSCTLCSANRTVPGFQLAATVEMA